jgi:hypothetical protein
MHGLTGGSWKRSTRPTTATEKNYPTGKPSGNTAPTPTAGRSNRASSRPSKHRLRILRITENRKRCLRSATRGIGLRRQTCARDSRGCRGVTGVLLAGRRSVARTGGGAPKTGELKTALGCHEGRCGAPFVGRSNLLHPRGRGRHHDLATRQISAPGPRRPRWMRSTSASGRRPVRAAIG